MDEQMVQEKSQNELNNDEIDIVQQFRSDLRKSRYQKLPILISILKEINNSSNLFDLAIRYEKYKTKQQTQTQKEEQLNELMSSISFQQTKSNINPYQDVTNMQTQNISEKKNDQFKNIINLLEATELNIKSDLMNIEQENKKLKKNIRSYFDSLWTSTSIKNTQVNELNYGLQDRQEHYISIQLCIPTLEQEKQELMNLKSQQQILIQNQTKDLEEFNQNQENCEDQKNYISELKIARQQVENQVTSLSEKIEKLKQAQDLMNLETKIEQFCNQILIRKNEGRSKIIKNFEEYIDNMKLKFMRKHKEKTKKSFLYQEMVDFEDQILRQEMEEFCLNRNEQESKIKIQNLRSLFQGKIQKIIFQKQQLLQENIDLTNSLTVLSSNQYQERLKSLSDQKEKLLEENISKEKEILELQAINQAGQLMVEDLERQKQLILQKKNNNHLSKFARIKNKLMI